MLSHVSCLMLSLQPHGVKPARLLCPWDFPGNNTGIRCHFLLQGTFLTQGLNTHLLHWQEDFLPLVSPGMLRVIMLLWKLTIPLWQFEATYQNKVFPSLWPSWSPHPVNFMIQQLQTVSLCKPYLKDLLCCQSYICFPPKEKTSLYFLYFTSVMRGQKVPGQLLLLLVIQEAISMGIASPCSLDIS